MTDAVATPPVWVFLETERLVLRRFTASDVDNLVELDGDPAVMRFINGGRPTPRTVVEHELLPELLDHYRRHAGHGRWAAVERSSGSFLGWFGMWPVPGAGLDEADLGYRLRRSAWGRGLATEGSLALIHKGFTELGLRRIMATTMTVNLRSRRVMEKAGLRYVRTFHLSWPDSIEGTEEGDVEYEILKPDWESARPARLATADVPDGTMSAWMTSSYLSE